MNIGKFSVSNPVLVNIAMIAILVMGFVSLSRLPREAMSNVDFSWVFIATPYPGATAEQIEKSVTIPVEEEVSDVDHIKRISSQTSQGVSFVSVEFEDDIARDDFLRLFQDVRAEFDKVDLPDGTMEPWIDEFSTADFMPIITLNLKGDVDDETINRLARELRDKILDIDNVSKVEIVGGREREVWVEVNRDRMEALGISLDEIINALKYRNLNVPGGVLEEETRRYLLQTLGEIDDYRDFSEVIVRRRPGMGSVKVGDIATVNPGLAPTQHDVRFNGEKAISLNISKKRDGNSIRIVNQVRETADRFAESMPPGLSIHYFNDTSLLIREVVDVLSKNALMGFVTLVLVLLVFIGVRNSIITALGIPITFAITFMFMEAVGESLNGNSLFALVMVLGMIVDHAIVIIENAYRHRQMGLSSRDAAIVGTNEVIKPVISGTLTTVAAFLPMMLLPGIMGKFMRIIPMVVCLALAASTLEALIFLPSHFADWGTKAKEMKEGFIGRWQGSFRRLVTVVFRHRYLTLFATLMAIVVSAGLATQIKQNLYAGEEFTMFFIDLELPIGTPRPVTNRVASRFEQRILPLIGNGEVHSITTQVGFMANDDDWVTNSNVAQITVDVVERKEGRERPIRDIMEDVKAMCSDIPGADVVNYRMVNNGPPVDKPVTFRIQGESYDDMVAVAEEYVEMLEQYESDSGLYNIGHDYERGYPELRIQINEERAADLGLNAGLIGLHIRNSFEGAEATTYFEQDDEIDVIVKWAEPYRVSIDDVLQMKFPAPAAGADGAPRMVPFSTVASIERGRGVAEIRRGDQQREVTVTAESYNKDMVARVVMPKVEETWEDRYRKTYPELSLVVGGEFAEFGKVVSDLLRLLGVGLFLMYVILGAQFKSFFQPLIIGTAISFAFVGCVLFLLISGTPLSIVVMFAGVALTGICVNDSIVLISFINGLRRRGVPTHEAVVEGCGVRLRPIILTSVTTIGGLFPMAVGLGGRSDIWAPMASTIMFGLLFSTVGTLLVIPCLYGIFDDMAVKFGFTMRLEGEESSDSDDKGAYTQQPVLTGAQHASE
ncbi:MAG: MMPL family transporter [Chitinivibrionales bacterium]|nr:MMPL family transporter [Chitinivibrionales bacterium]